jgi:hypothetical protein
MERQQLEEMEMEKVNFSLFFLHVKKVVYYLPIKAEGDHKVYYVPIPFVQDGGFKDRGRIVSATAGIQVVLTPIIHAGKPIKDITLEVTAVASVQDFKMHIGFFLGLFVDEFLLIYRRYFQ